MKGSFLLTRPNHEQTTQYLFAWAEAVLEKAKEKNILTTDLCGSDASKSKFKRAVEKYHPAFVYLNGHGSPNEVTGYNNEPLVKFADNEKLTAERVVYALSCQSAKRLGKSCVSFGAKTYLGYDEDFIFVFDEDKQSSPIEDQTAANFLQPSNALVNSIIDGKATGEAFENSQESFTQSIVKYSLSEATAEERELLPYLLWDREHQVCLGNKEEKCEFVLESDFKRQQARKRIIFGLFLALVIIVILVMSVGFFGFS